MLDNKIHMFEEYLSLKRIKVRCRIILSRETWWTACAETTGSVIDGEQFKEADL